ncbi:MAG: bifunctional DNA-formamidopyrimidine glycosylase/DNA-(apurinic or apyrimidinic site) lyase [Patescibacteria group bacterium]
MPELPEVECIQKGLQQVILNRKINNITINNHKTISSKSNKREVDLTKSKDFVGSLIGQEIKKVYRNSKQIIIELENHSLLIHLKMTGQLLYQIEPKIDKHCCLIIELDYGYLIYRDVRKFGYVLLINNIDINSELGEYGLDPQKDILYLDLIYEKFQRSSKPLKTSFLEQKIICGVGNIYSDEISFLSGIKPMRLINSITKKELSNLLHHTKEVINDSINKGGSSISDYILSDGSKGLYALEHKVYGRGGKNCLKCNEILYKTKIAGRTTVFCDFCQK